MKHLKTYAASFALLVSAFVVGCTSLGVNPATFNERVAACISSTTSVREFAGSLLEADEITPAEAENANKQASTLRDGCELANDLKGVDLNAAEGKLQATRIALDALRDYLEERQ